MASWCVQISYPKNQHSTTSYHISTNNNHNGDEIVKKKKIKWLILIKILLGNTRRLKEIELLYRAKIKLNIDVLE